MTPRPVPHDEHSPDQAPDRIGPAVAVCGTTVVVAATDDQDERHAARALLRQLLAEVAGPAAASAPLGARPHGQPFLIGHTGIGISLSHTEGWVAAAVHPAGVAIGVDVQAPVPVNEPMLRRCCTPETQAVIAALPPTDRAGAFARVWTVQEACVKATGEGIAGLPWTVPVAPGQRHGRWRDVRWTALAGRWPVPVGFAHLGRMEATCTCPP